MWKGEPLEVTDELGSTPLILAAVQGHATCVSALLEGGADLSARTNFGDTALTLAASGGHVQTRPGAAGGRSRSPIHRIARDGRPWSSRASRDTTRSRS